MSQPLISRSADLKQLRDDGYAIEIREGHLLLHDVPYVGPDRQVHRGTLVSVLDMAGQHTAPPTSHVAYFVGQAPSDREGRRLDKVIIGDGAQALAPSVIINFTLSSKPKAGKYDDYHAKMATYAAIFEGQAQAADPVTMPTAKTFRLIDEAPDESVFQYWDTASSRAGIAAITEKLDLPKIAVIGLGGTGSYVLDLVAKTPVREIHIFDGDDFSQHNAFRAPGAPLAAIFEGAPVKKVDYFQAIYSQMHRGVVAHGVHVNEANVALLSEMAFVFLCLDKGEPKELIVKALEDAGIPFVDVGMGLYAQDDQVYGMVRVTTSTPDYREHVHSKNRISFADGDIDEAYASNIQVADLNSLNAALAVIRWKKHFRFYGDFDGEHFSVYTVDGNLINNEDQHAPGE